MDASAIGIPLSSVTRPVTRTVAGGGMFAGGFVGGVGAVGGESHAPTSSRPKTTRRRFTIVVRRLCSGERHMWWRLLDHRPLLVVQAASLIITITIPHSAGAVMRVPKRQTVPKLPAIACES
jgi:hypothetical protein